MMDFGPKYEIDRIIKHCNLNSSQLETYTFLANRCTEQDTDQVTTTAVQLGQSMGVGHLTAQQRLISLQKVGLIHKVGRVFSRTSFLRGTVFRVALKLEEVGALGSIEAGSDAAEAPAEAAETDTKGGPPQVVTAALQLLRRSGVQLEDKAAYEARLRQAQDDVAFYYQIVQNYDTLSQTLSGE